MEQAIKILEVALNGANKAGVFTLQESATVFQAFHTVKASLETKTENVTEVKSSKK